MEMEDEEYEAVKALVDPVRLTILGELIKEEDYVAQLSKKLQIPRSQVVYHLGRLESHGYVQSHYRVLKKAASKGRAARFYKVNKERVAWAIKKYAQLVPK